ncbi:SGNH/GDSL hydrolase family protein [Paenibacillus peoriae]|uniref:SGNH/GDSL hydrolase family protein n=1 Tax=Paenibacillus peoriae TaxID=59893 RepID=A0A7H0YAV1_9BACL|nr:SGNH/GDSL hydrolase family protein [Paenibacillus peoriae]QNR68209.1 SGNH/GDSL hydrolase family protein [Paenibacillus peoriae]
MTINQGKYQGSHAVFLGDSITFGYELRDGEKPYPHLVSDALGFLTFENHGISGSSVASGGFEPMCERYEKMNPHADVIFFMGGRNDFSMGEIPFGSLDTPSTETSTFYGALKHIAEGLINRYPDKLIVFLTPPHGSSDTVPEHLPNAITGQVYSAYAQAVREVASLYSFPCCDLWNIAGIQPLMPVHKQMYFTGENGIPDGLHPNQAGHERMAARIIGFMNTL